MLSAVKQCYPDFDKIILMSVDTVTIGDNLSYRMEQAQHSIDWNQSQAEYYRTRLQENKRHGFASLSKLDQESYDDYSSMVEKEKQRYAALDSLKHAIGPINNQVTAYTYQITYNYPGNIVWAQIDAFNTILVVTKDRNKVLFNPGEDAPGYFEIWERFSSLNN